MNKSEYVKQQQETCRAEWFKDHKATLVSGAAHPPMTIIEWRKPTSSNYYCRFIIQSRWLIVVGDIGEAIYEWSEDLTLGFLLGLDFGYFHSKCQASETGRKFNQWDANFANAAITTFIDETVRECKEESARIPEWIDDLEGISSNTDRFEFEGYIRDANNSGLESSICSDLVQAGSIPNTRCIGHFVGLKMAIEQIKTAQALKAKACPLCGDSGMISVGQPCMCAYEKGLVS